MSLEAEETVMTVVLVSNWKYTLHTGRISAKFHETLDFATLMLRQRFRKLCMVGHANLQPKFAFMTKL